MTENERPVLDQINLVVNDMDAMIEFYRRLGLNIDDGGADWNPHHRTASDAGLDLDFDSQAFAAVWNKGHAGRAGAVIGFRVPSREAVDTLFSELTGAGYHGQQPPYDAFWGARYAIVEDPDGNSVGLMSPADPEMRTRPPLSTLLRPQDQAAPVPAFGGARVSRCSR